MRQILAEEMCSIIVATSCGKTADEIFFGVPKQLISHDTPS